MRRSLLRLAGLLLLAPIPATARPFVAGPTSVFPTPIVGSEGITFDRTGHLVVGTQTGDIRRIAPDGSATVLTNVGDSLAGVTGLRDGRILACAFTAGRVWQILPDGMATVLADGIPGANFVVATRSGKIFVSASNSGQIMEISTGVAIPAATGLSFPNGLALGRDQFLYVAELLAARIVRLPIAANGTLGAAEVYTTGTTFVDGIAFDRDENLLAVGGDTLYLIDRATRVATPLPADPLLDWPANLVFGQGRGFRRRDVFLVNYGFPLGSGTTIVKFRGNHAGAKLER
jgi:sugar lactone lactonase YvrE